MNRASFQLIHGLVRNQHKDPLILAIIATEMQFRPRWFRMCEYLFYLISGSNFTIGIAQIKASTWTKENRLLVLNSALSSSQNYVKCAQVIECLGQNPKLKSVARCYTGDASKLYISRLRANYKLTKRIASI